MAVATARSKFSVLVDQGDSDSSDGEFVKVQKPKKVAAAAKKKAPVKNTSEPRTAAGSIPGMIYAKPAPMLPLDTKQKKKGSEKSVIQSSAEDREWRKYEEEAAEGQYREELAQAILLSKLNSAGSSELPNTELAHNDAAVATVSTSTNKKGRLNAHTVSLDEFNQGKGDPFNVQRTSERKLSNHSADESGDGEDLGRKTLDQIMKECEAEAEKVIQAEKLANRKREDLQSVEVVQLNIYKAKLEECITKNQELETKVDSLQADLAKAKQQRKRLLNVLSDAETREKAELLVELERTKGIRDELTSQVAELTAALEREKSKLHEYESKKTIGATVQGHGLRTSRKSERE